jgi:hypothetical protein
MLEDTSHVNASHSYVLQDNQILHVSEPDIGVCDLLRLSLLILMIHWVL